MTASTTLIRVPTAVRDRIRVMSQASDVTFGDVITLGLDAIEREQFWDTIAQITPDDAYRAEFAEWDAA